MMLELCVVHYLFLALLPCGVCDYIAGVVNHDVFYGSGHDDPAFLIDINLQLYENITALANRQGAQVLVFPEFGLEPVRDANRTDLYSYAEFVPNISSTLVIPCDHKEEFANRPILHRMSCAAKRSSIVVLINMVDSQPCNSTTDTNCPEDYHYQYNTDVVFDETGAIVAKYHKTHVWISNLGKYDQPARTEYVTYLSSTLGVEFGLFICFDIVFPDPALVLVERGIKHFLYAVEQGYLGDATIMPHWSLVNDAALLASNLQLIDAGTKVSASKVFVQGKTLKGKKHFLHDESFPDENVLIVSVPTDF